VIRKEAEKALEKSAVSVIDIPARVLVVNGAEDGAEDRVHPLFGPPPLPLQPIPALHDASSQLEHVTNEP
jgi:hypothetical protein